jgi:hypothetical protein
MTFPASFEHEQTVMCFMIIGIQASKVERVAMELFGVHVDTDNGVRCLVHSSGAVSLAAPGQYIPLQGAPPDSVRKILGQAIDGAISETPQRQREVERGIHATRCVSLRIPENPNDDAILNLNLGLIQGFQMKDMLFQ